MVVVRARGPDEGHVHEVRVDPGHGRQLPVLRVVEEVPRREEAPPVEVRELVQIAEPELRVGEAERPHVVRVPAPRDLVRLEMAHERRNVVDRDAHAVLAPGRLPAQRVQPIRPGRARHRAEPAVADHELAREMVVHGQLAPVVVAHHHVAELRLLPLLGEVRDEAAHVVAHLLRRAPAAVARVLVLRQRGSLQVADLVLLASVGVRHARLQPVDVRSLGLEREVPEHVVEGAVLEHEDDDVVDLAEVREIGVGRRDRSRACAAA